MMKARLRLQRPFHYLRSYLVAAAVIAAGLAHSQSTAPAPAPLPEVSPYLVHSVGGGGEIVKRMPALSTDDGAWTAWAWVNPTSTTVPAATVPIVTLHAGEPVAQDATNAAARKPTDRPIPLNGPAIALMLEAGKPAVIAGPGKVASASILASGGWHLLLATGDRSHLQLFVDGQPAGQAGESVDLHGLQGWASTVVLAPRPLSAQESAFRGRIAFSFSGHRMSAADVTTLYATHLSTANKLDAALFEENAKPWHEQVKQQVGYVAPQPPEEMPHGAAAAAPVAKPLPPPGPTLQSDSTQPESGGLRQWTVARNWKLFANDAAQFAPADGARISSAGFNDTAWLAATVPGTVLTTMVDRGIYPDPDFGLNNLAIPESLNKHDYWYRVRFDAPATRAARTALHFAGTNYRADVWFNGKQLGTITGAFRRGDFDVTALLRSNENTLAVRISPPPHPGIPQEESMRAGPGENGGEMLIDGPTFVASEGWDWIPSIRDRNTGIWQPVTLTQTGAVKLGDPQVITRLPLPDNTQADVELHVPVHNAGATPRRVQLTVDFEGVHITTTATVPPGESIVHLLPATNDALHLDHPRLWWPNGYGKPELYHLRLMLADALQRTPNSVFDTRSLTFGVREVSYELSLFDHAGDLQRVEAIPTVTAGKGDNPVDVTHAGMRHTDKGAASSMNASAEGTPALVPVTNEPGFTDLVIKVNGVRIAARGGNWGMDDSRKRASRDKLEPYFRLHREANLNIIRNWVGQDTEETFFQLADEYGLMVWNDFWASTENYNAEPGDPELFADNARDTVRRYRNHPSIVLWCGRNEGVPPPVLNEKLIALLRDEDGTRLYSPSSNNINLRGSGPYSYQDPAYYYAHNLGFSVELGISSFSTLESFQHSIAKSDQWPVSDAWAYHDWHQGGGGDVHELMRHVDTQLGAPTSLPDFDRTLQMFNYVDHRAIFEGFYQKLWKPNSGRMIWMTHPAWPSNMWQMYSSDYDTQASFYGVKKANEPIHVQMDLNDFTVAAVNTTQSAVTGATVRATLYTLDGKPIGSPQQQPILLPANAVTTAFQVPLAAAWKQSKVALVRLELKGASDNTLADNTYWLAQNEPDYRALRQMPTASIQMRSTQQASSQGEAVWDVELTNLSATPALAAKLTLLDAHGERVLPAYYSDNYIALLPGETRRVNVHAPTTALHGDATHFSLRGWNVEQATQ